MDSATKRVLLWVVTVLLVIAAVMLFVFGAVLHNRGQYAVDEVKSQLGAQRISFPEKGTPALDPKTYPDLQKYAGQKVDNGAEAKAYANGYIRRHLAETNDGKTYSETSTDARAARTAADAAKKSGAADAAALDAKATALEAKVQTLFRGEALRGMLLNAWGWWLEGRYALTATIVLYATAGAALVGAVAVGLIAGRSRRQAAA